MKTFTALLALCILSSSINARNPSAKPKRSPLLSLLGGANSAGNTLASGALDIAEILGHDAVGAVGDVAEVGIDVFEQMAEQLLQADSVQAALFQCMASLGKVAVEVAEQVADQVVDSLVTAVGAALLNGASPDSAVQQGAGSVLGSLTSGAADCLASALQGVLGELGNLTGVVDDITGVVDGVVSGLTNNSLTDGVGGVVDDVASGATGALGGLLGASSNSSDLTGDVGSVLSGATDAVGSILGGSSNSTGSSSIVGGALSGATGAIGGLLG